MKFTIPMSDEEIRMHKPVCPDFVDFRAGIRCAERVYGVADLLAQAERDTALLRQALEALEIGYSSAKAEADQYHAAMARYMPHHHAQMDADVQQIAKAITATRERLKE